MHTPTLTTWLNQLLDEGISQSVKMMTLKLEKDGDGWLVQAFGYTKPSKESRKGEGEGIPLSGEYPLQLREPNTPTMEAVRVGREAADYLRIGSGKERLLAMECITILDSDGKSHLLYDKENHRIHDPASSERRMSFLLILSFLALLLPTFDPSMGIFGILLGLYGIWLTHGIFKKHRKARCAFVLSILSVAIGACNLAMMLIAAKGGAL